MTSGIITKHLAKTYHGSKQPALDALDLQVHAGEVYGFLGANGAGKSTTIRLLLNFLQPTSGSATICELDVVRQSVAVKRHVGYLAGDVALYPKMTGREVLDYLWKLQGGSHTDYRKHLVQCFEAELTKPIGTLSKGNRQKVGLIQALMHQPDVLILDEPTSGLDPMMQEVFYEAIRDARSRGAAVLMSSHNLAEAQAICNRIGIIKHGRLIHEQKISSEQSLGATTFKVRFASLASLQKVATSTHMKLLQTIDDRSCTMQPTGTLATALADLSQLDVVDLQTEQLNLEDEFMSFYGDAS